MNARRIPITELEKFAENRRDSNVRDNLLDKILDPDILLEKLVKDMHVSFNEFEKNYPAHQSATVRRCLARIHSTIDSIIAPLIRFRELEEVPTADLRLAYYQLYGLLVELRMIIQDKKGRVPEALLKTLTDIFSRNLLCETPLTRVEYSDCHEKYMDLVTKVNTNMVAEINDKNVKINNYLRILPKENLHQFEVNAFNDLMVITRSTAKMFADSTIYHQVYLDTNKVLQQINALKPLKFPGADLKLFITTLKNINEILSHIQLTHGIVTVMAGDKLNWHYKVLEEAVRYHSQKALKLCEEFKKFIQHVEQGKPSIHKALAGAFVALLGGIMVLTGIIVTIFSGLSAPICTTGTALGVATLIAGIGLFKTSHNSGVSKALINLDHSLTMAFVAPALIKEAEPAIEKSRSNNQFHSPR